MMVSSTFILTIFFLLISAKKLRFFKKMRYKRLQRI